MSAADASAPGHSGPGAQETARYDDIRDATTSAASDAPAMLEAALQWASEGVDVFPVHPQAKRPLHPRAHPGDTIEGFVCRGECGRPGHGFHDATTDPTLIREWWSRWPRASIAAPTGRRFDVLDIDTRDLAEGGADLPNFAGVYVQTRNGHHFYMLPTGLGRRIRFARCADWLGTNGYVVLPPSEGYKFGGTPRDLLRALRPAAPELIQRATPPPPPTPAAAGPTTRPKYRPPQYAPRRGAPSGVGLIRTVRDAPRGTRNSVLWWAARVVGLEVHDGKRTQDAAAHLLDELHQAAVAAGLTDQETALTVRSGFARGASGSRGRT